MTLVPLPSEKLDKFYLNELAKMGIDEDNTMILKSKLHNTSEAKFMQLTVCVFFATTEGSLKTIPLPSI